ARAAGPVDRRPARGPRAVRQRPQGDGRPSGSDRGEGQEARRARAETGARGLVQGGLPRQGWLGSSITGKKGKKEER
ncbi:unnamed protein product, partial [Ectocarpus fasciculatus]